MTTHSVGYLIGSLSSTSINRLLAKALDLRPVRDDEDVLVGDHRLKARDRVLDHRPFAEDMEKLLGRSLTALRPESRSNPTGHDYGVDVHV